MNLVVVQNLLQPSGLVRPSFLHAFIHEAGREPRHTQEARTTAYLALQSVNSQDCGRKRLRIIMFTNREYRYRIPLEIRVVKCQR
ncbi:hypothetical protein SAMN05216386_2808 [Nitrosospira briensis]|uniref:Uncharacterized protein n=1 Tax=Nitrosospira briensis TaxID=35799 RepID=A0A1I5EXY2_9PROT|nr:hypothetical protein SAMN05216386_2808 [Nitrosospira briensis]